MKRILLFLSALFIATTAIAHTINWYVDGSVYHTTTCESGENVTPPTAPEKYGYTFRGWDNYTPIEYLESTETQYIDTGYKPNSNTRAVVEFMATSYITDKPAWLSTLFSARTSTNLETYGEFVCSQDSPNGLRSDYGTNMNEQSCGTNLLLKKIKVDKNKNVTTYTYNGTVLSTIITSVQTFSTPYSLWLFRINDAGRPLGASNIRLYSCKIYDNDVLVRDFIPILDIEGTPCMYDLVERKLYYNAGTGDFIAGPIIGE